MLINKISASELSRDFIKSALLVGYFFLPKKREGGKAAVEMSLLEVSLEVNLLLIGCQEKGEKERDIGS